MAFEDVSHHVGQRLTRGIPTCSSALNSQLFNRRHCHSEVWSCEGILLNIQDNRIIVQDGCCTRTSTCCCSNFRVTCDTAHGLFKQETYSYKHRTCMGTPAKKETIQNPHETRIGEIFVKMSCTTDRNNSAYKKFDSTKQLT
jgi:hypothetical protein